MLILYFFFVHFLLLIPAFGFLKYLKIFNNSLLKQVCLAYFCGIIFLGLTGAMLYGLNVSEIVIRSLLWGVAFIGTILFIKTRAWQDLLKNRLILIIFLLMSLLPTLILSLSSGTANQKFFPDPEYISTNNYKVLNVKVLNFAHTQANDNYIPYRQAQFFVNNSDPAKDSFISEWGVNFFQRTVLMGSVVSSFFTLFNDDPPIAYTWSAVGQDQDFTYAKFQIIAHILNSVLILPVFLLAARLFNNKTALITALFIGSSHFYLSNSIFSWPKSLTAFFILFSIILVFENKFSSTLLAGLSGGIAYMTHDLAIIFILTALFHMFLKKRYRDVLLYMVGSLPFPILWTYISSIIYHRQSTFIYYPFSINGLPQENNKHTIIKDFFHTNIFKILKIKWEGLFRLATPYQLLVAEQGKDWSTRLWAVGIYTIPGSLGLGLLPVGVYALVRGYKKIRWEVWLYMLFPVLLILLIFGDPTILGSLHFSQSIVALTTATIIYILLGFKKYVSQLIISGLSINIMYSIFFVVYSYNFEIGRWFSNISDICNMFTIIFIYVFLLWILCNVLLKWNGPVAHLIGVNQQLKKKV